MTEANRAYLGLDIGSAASKCAIIDETGELVGRGIYPSGAGTPGPERALADALGAASLTLEQIAFSCATGYGRHLIEWTDCEMSELSCHARGAVELFGPVRTVIDIGGQDAKVLSLGDDGALQNFVMNDKCAAGTGRFLDVMAQVFGCATKDLSGLDTRSIEPAAISSTCTVFAESEVISKLAQGVEIANIVAGVHESVVDRTVGLAKRVGIAAPIALTGGVALNDSLRRRLSDRIGAPIMTSPLAQMNGALGAALIARQKAGYQKTTPTA